MRERQIFLPDLQGLDDDSPVVLGFRAEDGYHYLAAYFLETDTLTSKCTDCDGKGKHNGQKCEFCKKGEVHKVVAKLKAYPPNTADQLRITLRQGPGHDLVDMKSGRQYDVYTPTPKEVESIERVVRSWISKAREVA